GTGYYVYADQIDTPRVITDTNNLMVWRWDQADPFGATLPDENPASLGTFTYNLRFPGQVYDAETGKHYNANRDYDPASGRYVQSDPIGLNGGQWSTYAYVGGNPTRYTDASGLCPWCVIGALIELGVIANEIANSDVPMIGGNSVGAVVRAVERSVAKEAAQSCTATAARGAQIPKVAEAAARGRQAHKAYDYGPGFEKEFTLPSGKRADAVNQATREVVELKPNNPSAVRRGERQVDGYRRELEKITGECWSCRVITYE
ncbi:RHS repeat-associated core domain-containing protein, partial [Ralstonia solanacearum]|uniref:RHS repeat-associated core domain-containing protein n=3 Tax=Ralstonia solanacearum TaxID=305 RepID=UPI0035EEF053